MYNSSRYVNFNIIYALMCKETEYCNVHGYYDVSVGLGTTRKTRI